MPCRVEVRSVTILIILRPEAFVARPGLDQGAVHGEMFVGQQGPDLSMVQQCLHDSVENIAGLQALAILGKRRGMPHRVIRRSPTNQRYSRL